MINEKPYLHHCCQLSFTQPQCDCQMHALRGHTNKTPPQKKKSQFMESEKKESERKIYMHSTSSNNVKHQHYLIFFFLEILLPHTKKKQKKKCRKSRTNKQKKARNLQFYEPSFIIQIILELVPTTSYNHQCLQVKQFTNYCYKPCLFWSLKLKTLNKYSLIRKRKRLYFSSFFICSDRKPTIDVGF